MTFLRHEYIWTLMSPAAFKCHFPGEVARRHSRQNPAPVTTVPHYWLASCFAVCWVVAFLLCQPFQWSHVMTLNAS